MPSTTTSTSQSLKVSSSQLLLDLLEVCLIITSAPSLNIIYYDLHTLLHTLPHSSSGCVVLGLVQVGFFLAGAAAGAAISFMLFSVIGDHLGAHANIIRYVFYSTLLVPSHFFLIHIHSYSSSFVHPER